jgi:phage terminase large subunit GpA-like protein
VILSAAFVAGVAPPRRLTVAEWADEFRVVSRGTSPAPGPWRTARVPYLREPMEAISDPRIETVVCQWASQVGKTDGMLLNAIGYFAAQDPAPMLVVQPLERDAHAFGKERVDPMFRDTPALRGLLSQSLRDKDNTTDLKMFPGGYLAFAWSTSASSLAARPIRILFCDELDRWAPSTGRDGDPLEQAKQRTTNFRDRKIILVSSPTVDGESRIAQAYSETDRRQLHVPCQRCGAEQVLRWAGIQYKNASGAVDLDDVHYRCEHCGERMEEREKPAMIADAVWRPGPRREDELPANPKHRGYQLSSLYSPWVQWRDLAEQWIKANKNRNTDEKQGMREFVNLKLGETWVIGADEVRADDLEGNREDYGEGVDVPAGAVVLTAGVDVQDGRLEVEVISWGPGKESWGVRYAIFPGDTSDTSPTGPWGKLDRFLALTFATAGGSVLPISCTCIDSGGHRTTEVYDFCRARAPRQIFAIKGGKDGALLDPKPKVITRPRGGVVSLYHVGADQAKAVLFSRLQLREPGPGYCHFPLGAGYDGSFFTGLVSERRETRVRAGRQEKRWVQVSRRNEPLDCRNYGTAALELLLSWRPDVLEQLHRAAESTGAPVLQRRPAPGRRTISRGLE